MPPWTRPLGLACELGVALGSNVILGHTFEVGLEAASSVFPPNAPLNRYHPPTIMPMISRPMSPSASAGPSLEER